MCETSLAKKLLAGGRRIGESLDARTPFDDLSRFRLPGVDVAVTKFVNRQRAQPADERVVGR
jgi:hypothetical protein